MEHRDEWMHWSALALLEMRDLVSHFIYHFERVRFAPGEDGSRLVNGTKDHFTIGVQPLNLIFEKKDDRHGMERE